jgi:integrase
MRVKDLWFSEVKDPADPKKKIKRKTAKHPDNGGSRDAKRWLACWIGPDGREVTKAFRIQDAAKKYARQKEEEAERGEYVDPADAKQLFGPLARKWLKLRKVGGPSRVKYEQVIRLHIEPTFGKRAVGSIRPSEVLAWQRKLAETHGLSTQETASWIVTAVFDLAKADKMRSDNPARSTIVDSPRNEPAERAPWTDAQVLAVIDDHAAEYELVPMLGAGCGTREGEAFGVALDDFDFEAETVTIARQVAFVDGQWVFKLPKGGKSRTAPLPSGVAAAVKAFAEAYRPTPYALPWMNEDGRLAAEEHVCNLLVRWNGQRDSTRGRHIAADSYAYGCWWPAVARAGIIESTVGPRGGLQYKRNRQDTFHALRHWYATTLQNAGVPLGAVMDFCGHSKKGVRLGVTLGVYSHTTEEAFEAAREAINRRLFPLRPVQDQPSGGTRAERAAR